MYDRCYVCERSLGRNNVIATLPVGRVLAFDPEHGPGRAAARRRGDLP
jgi:hypothetical protein